MAHQSDLLEKAYEFKSVIRDWTPKRKTTVRILRELADKLKEHHTNVCIAQVSGSAGSVFGFTVAAVGFGLSFVTFGASLVVATVGMGIGAAGGLTNAGSTLAKIFIERDTYKEAQNIIDDDRKTTKKILELLTEIEESTVGKASWHGLQAATSGACTVYKFVDAGFKVGVRVASPALAEGGGALFTGLRGFSRVAHIGGFVVNAALLPYDIYTLVTNAMEIDAARKGENDKEPEAVKKLRQLADDLEKDMPPDENYLASKLDEFITVLQSKSIENQDM